jgi:chromosome segregation ATPase
MKLRTMRDIPTIQGLKNQATPTTREQAITELARLEHELSRLKRELEMWTANQNKTAERIHRVEHRLALLKGIVDPGAEERSARQRDHASSAGAQRSESDSGKPVKTVDFQY